MTEFSGTVPLTHFGIYPTNQIGEKLRTIIIYRGKIWLNFVKNWNQEESLRYPASRVIHTSNPFKNIYFGLGGFNDILKCVRGRCYLITNLLYTFKELINMKFDDDTLDYISGKKFSNGPSIKISKRNETIYNRFQIIESLCKNKNIIHLGCVDHLPLINKKIEQNIWLHARLCKVAKKCLGIDINIEGIDYLKYKLGYKDVIYGDIANGDISEIKEKYWDFLVMGEILEHVNNH